MTEMEKRQKMHVKKTTRKKIIDRETENERRKA